MKKRFFLLALLSLTFSFSMKAEDRSLIDKSSFSTSTRMCAHFITRVACFEAYHDAAVKVAERLGITTEGEHAIAYADWHAFMLAFDSLEATDRLRHYGDPNPSLRKARRIAIEAAKNLGQEAYDIAYSTAYEAVYTFVHERVEEILETKTGYSFYAMKPAYKIARTFFANFQDDSIDYYFEESYEKALEQLVDANNSFRSYERFMDFRRKHLSSSEASVLVYLKWVQKYFEEPLESKDLALHHGSYDPERIIFSLPRDGGSGQILF